MASSHPFAPSPTRDRVDSPARWRRVAWYAVGVWLVSHLVLQAAGALIGARAGTSPGTNLLNGPFNYWDSGWFRSIATYGYFRSGLGAADIAFFPGYPAASAGAGWLLGLGTPTEASVISGMWLVSAVASLVFLLFLARIAFDQYGAVVARRALILAGLGPYALFLVASYSEALYLAFAAAAWWAARRERYWLAGLLAAGASFTRISGVFLVAGLLVMYVAQRRRDGARVVAPGLIGVLIGGAGVGAYCGYIWSVTGSPTAWLVAQRVEWGREFHWPWYSFASQGNRMLVDIPDRRIQAWFEMGYALLCVAIAVAMIRQRKWPEATYLVISLAALMTSSGYESLARNMLTVVPLFIFVAHFVTDSRRRWLYPVTVVVGLLILAFNVWQFTHSRWAG